MKRFLIAGFWFALLAIATGIPDEAVKAADGAAGQHETTTKKAKHNYGTLADRTKLVAHLFNNVTYNKFINPDDLHVQLGMVLIDFNICQKKKRMHSHVWLNYKWFDHRLKWDPTDFGGVSAFSYESDEVWKPDITLYNSGNTVTMMNCWHSNVVIESTGKVSWIPPCKLVSMCSELDLVREPYGKQNCSMKFGSWTFDGGAMDLQIYKGQSTIDTSLFPKTSSFEILSTHVVKHTKFYSCCQEPYHDILFSVIFKKKEGEYWLTSE